MEVKVRYSDEELEEFRQLILEKLEVAKRDYETLMDQLAGEGYEEVLCQPTHIISGLEYNKILDILKRYAARIPRIRMGKPLLTSEEDYLKTADIVMSELPRQLKTDEALILMGHGTEHKADNIYTLFEHVLRDVGYANVFVGTVEGFLNVDYLIRRLKRRAFRKIYAMPLMVVAGDHACNDLAGEEKDTWNSKLKDAGYETELILKGLGDSAQRRGVGAKDYHIINIINRKRVKYDER